MLSPLNLREDRSPEQLAADGDAPAERVLPSARELAECHGEEELKRLKGLATSVADTEAVTLFGAAQKERKRIEIENAFARPAVWRAAEAERKAMYEQYQNAKTLMVQGPTRLEAASLGSPAYLGLSIGAGVAQSAGPSE